MLPPGYRLEWSGQFEAMERAGKKLRVVVPITLAIIFLLLYFNFRSVTESAIVHALAPVRARRRRVAHVDARITT